MSLCSVAPSPFQNQSRLFCSAFYKNKPSYTQRPPRTHRSHTHLKSLTRSPALSGQYKSPLIAARSYPHPFQPCHHQRPERPNPTNQPTPEKNKKLDNKHRLKKKDRHLLATHTLTHTLTHVERTNHRQKRSSRQRTQNLYSQPKPLRAQQQHPLSSQANLSTLERPS